MKKSPPERLDLKGKAKVEKGGEVGGPFDGMIMSWGEGKKT